MDQKRKTEALWEQLLSLFPEEREQRLLYLSYNCGLKPAEIARLYPQEFMSIQEIYRLHGSIFDRLQRNADLLPGLMEPGNARYRNM
ncbi:MAG TPA: hypothetical protein VGT44_15275 [Ktedonobacteraceae bacterium]|nr:hypothetical protein [Ktedonobacteraceae bacterium]